MALIAIAKLAIVPVDVEEATIIQVGDEVQLDQDLKMQAPFDVGSGVEENVQVAREKIKRHYRGTNPSATY